MADLIWVFVMARMGLSFDCLKSLQHGRAPMADSHEIARAAVPVSEVAHEGLIWWL